MPIPYRGLSASINDDNPRYIGSRAVDWAEKNVLPKVQEVAQSDNLAGSALRTIGWLGQQQERIPGYTQAEDFLTQKGAAGAKKFNIDPRIGMMAGMIAMPGIEDLIPGGDALKIASKTRKASKLTKIATKGAKEGILSGTGARRLQGSLQIKPEKVTRAPSVTPNLPQTEIDDYITDATAKLRAGGRNRKDVDYLIDKDGLVFRMDQKKTLPDGTKQYALIQQGLKNTRNAKLDPIRKAKGDLTTKKGVDQREFYRDPNPADQHIQGVEQPHHRASLHASSKLKRGLSKREGDILDTYLETKGIPTGNNKFNRDNLPIEVHRKLHSWQKRNKIHLGDEDLTTLSLTQRKKYIDKFVEDMARSDVKTFELMKKYTKGSVTKKTKPTQFPDKIQEHIKRSQEIGITEPSWKDGSIDYIWRPQSNTGQIDIPPQNLKTFKGLRDEFFNQIEDLPSGSVWELNPKFKDAKRRRIYSKLFEGDKRITRNADETLGWVLTIP